MKILIAGGAGYVGSSLVPVLIERGYDVDIVDLLWFGRHLPDNVNVLQKNLFDCTEEDVEQYDQVVFLAGLSNDPMAKFDPSINFVFNAALPSYFAFISKNAGVRRFIYASSCSVYGYTVEQLYDEQSPVTCGYPYGISKLQGERGVLQLGDENFSVIALRKGTVCGFSPRMRMDLLVNAMFKTAMTEGRVIIHNPSIWRPVLDIRDGAMAYLRAIQADYSLSGVYNIASGNYTVGQVGDIVKQEVERLKQKKVDIIINDIEDFRNYKVTFEKAKTYLGFQPQHAVMDMVHDLYSNREHFGDYNNEQFYNIKVFMKLKDLIKSDDAERLLSYSRL
jgi:nucleoside-diphosphate-sugar epimerase